MDGLLKFYDEIKGEQYVIALSGIRKRERERRSIGRWRVIEVFPERKLMGPDGKWPLDFDYPSAGEILIVYWPFFFFSFFLVSIVWNGKVLSFVEKKSSIYISRAI